MKTKKSITCVLKNFTYTLLFEIDGKIRKSHTTQRKFGGKRRKINSTVQSILNNFVVRNHHEILYTFFKLKLTKQPEEILSKG